MSVHFKDHPARVRNRQLANHRDELAKKIIAEKREEAYAAHLDRQAQALEREIAELEGREYDYER